MTLTRAVWKLLRAQWWILLNNFRRAKGRTRFGYIILVIFLLGLAAGAFALSWAMLSALRNPRLMEAFSAGGLGDPTALIGSIPVLMLSGVFVITFVLSFQVLLQALYLAGDMDFLLSSPLPARAVFVAKLLEAALPNFLLFSLFTLPLLWGLGAANEYHALYYPLVVMLLVLQTLAAAGLSALLVMTVVRVFPARRVFEVISFLGAMIGMLCSQWYNLSRGFGGEEPSVAPAFGQAVNALDRFSVPWSPLAWPGLGLTALARGEWLPAVVYLTLSAGLSAGVFLLSLNVAERLYYSGWFKVRATPGRKPRRATARPAEKERVGRLPFLSPAVGGLLLKDFRVLRRDLRNLSQLLSPIILAVIYAVMIFRGGRAATDERAAAVIRQYSFYFTIFISLFACWGLTMRLAMMGFSQEGRYYWILKTAPLRPGQLVLAKWLAAFLPGAAVGSLLVVGIGIAQRAALGDVLFGWLVLVAVVAGNTGLNLAFGITGARLDWTDPRRMTSGGAGCLSSLLGMGFQVLSVALFLGPIFLAQVLHGPTIAGRLIGAFVGGVFCTAVAILPPVLVRKRISLIGEEGA
jgi:ABC-2 type transport system permease protein